MRHTGFLLLFLIALLHSRAQQDIGLAGTKILKITAADSNAVIRTAVKTQLNKAFGSKAQKNIKLFIKSTDKQTSLNIARRTAAKLEQNLLQVDLAAWTGKYLGETEKNLDILFSKASRNNCILFFDEADALFGKRGSDAGEDKASAVALLLDKLSNYKGTVVISCTGKDCRDNIELPLFVQVKAD
ncbi:MAG: AAA family ATPase [Ferruginibacter sp.]